MIARWLHITEHAGGHDPWVLPIWSSINQAVTKGICSAPDNSVGELGLHITTRLNMMPLIVNRINDGWKSLYAETLNYSDEKYVFENGIDGYATPINREKIYNLLIDIDAFLFEANSCCELMLVFLGEIYKLLGEPIKKKHLGKKLKQILLDNKQDPEWFILLDKERNFFTHKAAPYVAIDISNSKPELLIMKENLKSFNDSQKFTRLSELSIVVKGFSEAKIILQEHIIKLFNHRI